MIDVPDHICRCAGHGVHLCEEEMHTFSHSSSGVGLRPNSKFADVECPEQLKRPNIQKKFGFDAGVVSSCEVGVGELERGDT